MNDRKNKILLILFTCLLLTTVAAAYFKFFVQFDISTTYDDYGNTNVNKDADNI